MPKKKKKLTKKAEQKSVFEILSFWKNEKLGFKILLAGVLIALIIGGLAAGLGWATAWIYIILALGLIAGILNMFHKKMLLFVALLLTTTFMFNILAGLAVFPAWAVTLFNGVIYLLAPASIVICFKALYDLAF